MKYDEPEEGEWVFPRRRGYLLSCCDCGLVHRFEFRVRERHIEFRVFAEPRRTAQIRRWLKENK
jgi:Zn-finger protein